MAPSFLTLTLDGGGWLVLLPGETTPSNLWLGGWVGPRVGLNAMKKRKVLPLLGKEQKLSYITQKGDQDSSYTGYHKRLYEIPEI
jgi:hypothetical protein